MKTDEVPQEKAPTYGGVRKLLYAVDEAGQYKGVKSEGWEVETYVTLAAVDELKRQRDEALERAWAGSTSALEFHMYDRRMDIATLSSTTGIWRWRIRRHFKPDVFKGLSDGLLARYAFAMGVSPEQLRTLPENADV